MFDLVLKGGRVIDPAQSLDGVMDVAFTDGRVAAIGPNLDPGQNNRDVSGLLVTPGLIDLHAHVYWGGTSMGVDPDDYARGSGITTLIDAGSAGPGNMHGFRRHVIERSDVRIVPFLNISFAGIFAFSHEVMVGECMDLRLLNPRVCLAVAKRDSDLVAGIKVRIGGGTSAINGIEPLRMALEVAEHAGLPVMAHLDNPPPYRPEVMRALRAGDILTHCFRPFPNTPVTADGRVHQDVLEARARGVIFDIGHGKGSFGFETAMAMVKNGFLPDVISSDIHTLSIEGPAYNLLITMSKFLALGVALPEVIRMATINPARAARLSDRGTFRVGALGDASILTLAHGQFEYEDALGKKMTSPERLDCTAIVLGGRLWHEQGNC
ncbi:MAG: amidohydrolase/deacetylase family metallohydrolase [Acetobacteraceae bacterium]|nr:amidohydrolase/deacetylase family metallohydrolase [Acetobacteraceae bacterium]MSP29987.1 amidohydrolase/deacetylase family metallohydrolase [Acetobacteraceae bacterium]